MTNPFAFIVGNPRSGTTLLKHILDSHSQIAFLVESPWFMNWFDKGIGLAPDGSLSPGVVSLLMDQHRLFRDLDLKLTAAEMCGWIEGNPGFSWADFISNLCDRYGQARGKPHVGNKTPSFVRRIQAMHELWPHAKFIHIIRDGRDVFLSARMKWKDRPFRNFSTWTQDQATTSALWWEWNVRLGREAGRLLPPGFYYELRYERIVEDPATECARLCEFLSVPFESAMLCHQEAFQVRRTPDGRVVNASVALPITPGLRNWRTEMEPAELERFEAAAAGLLTELDYPLSCAQLSAERIEHASRTRKVFEGRPLPQLWRDYQCD